ncbi:dihydrodipicolinate synthase family protein [Cytophaga sp. FL35]|uniref:dihydrodipicolinate synthase family protein n=1 Tax=Cytophaga sp. FL35 TaxID=1904456 RepID=UPI0016534B99|nr:dihydrodipicolinate synthase family protein [Cytophaga sp. FL35]MBC6998921.1 dihydrodipicolinate synthase family protein [Cytophaga sp. FL35]
MKSPLKGVIPPMVTPLLQNLRLDVNGLENLIAHLLQGGVHGIFILGTNGEGPSLGYDVRKQLITESCRIIKGRVPVLVGITDTSFSSVLEMAQHAEQAGADYLVLAPPYYFPITQDEMIGYLEKLIPELPLPVVIYDIPGCTKLHLNLKTIKSARSLGVQAFKDSSGDLGALYTIMEAFKEDPEFSIIAGAELFMSDVLMNGGHGVVAGGANIFPSLFVQLYEASLNKDFEQITELRKKVLLLQNEIYDLVDSPTKSMRSIKSSLSIMGICSDQMVPPLESFREKEKKILAHRLSQLGIKANVGYENQ